MDDIILAGKEARRAFLVTAVGRGVYYINKVPIDIHSSIYVTYFKLS